MGASASAEDGTSDLEADLALGPILGVGTLGQVRLVVQRSSVRVLALKTMHKAHLCSLKQAEHVQNEREIAAGVPHHPFIVQLFSTAQDAACLYMLTEALLGGELYERLAEQKRLPAPEAAFNVGCVVSAIGHLHRYGVVYRDLKPENLLFDASGYLKVVDLGFAKRIGDGHTLTLCGTLEYFSPEALEGGGYGYSADWWATGVLLYEMLVGEPPFTAADEFELGALIEAGVPPLSGVDDDVVDLIRSLLQRHVSERLGCGPRDAQEIEEHPFFDTVARRASEAQGLTQLTRSSQWWEMLRAKQLAAPWSPKLSHDQDTYYFEPVSPGHTPWGDAGWAPDAVLEREEEVEWQSWGGQGTGGESDQTSAQTTKYLDP